MDDGQVSAGTTDCETVEMGDTSGSRTTVKVPRRTIYFASGETMEEYSTDEEEEEEAEEDLVKKDVATVDPVGVKENKKKQLNIYLQGH